jgi:hypothetical protein
LIGGIFTAVANSLSSLLSSIGPVEVTWKVLDPEIFYAMAFTTTSYVGYNKDGGFLGRTEGRRNPHKLAGLKFRVEVLFVCVLFIVFVLFFEQVLLGCK